VSRAALDGGASLSKGRNSSSLAKRGERRFRVTDGEILLAHLHFQIGFWGAKGRKLE